MRYSMIFLSVCAIFLGGCTLAYYPSDMQQSLQDMDQAQIKAAQKDLPGYRSADQNLQGLETGRLQQLSGDYSDSAATFNQVAQDVASQQESPRKQIGDDLTSDNTIIITDSAILPYRPAAFERIWLYNYEALNYLAEGKLSEAISWAAQAAGLQKSEAQRYQGLIDAMRAYPQDLSVSNSDYSPQAQLMIQYAQTLGPSFINPFSQYFLGILYQANGDLPNAINAFKQALQDEPSNTVVRQALLQALVQAGLNTEASDMANGLPVPNALKGEGTVVVVYEQGQIAQKQITALSPHWYAQSWSLPIAYYSTTTLAEATPLQVGINGKALGSSVLIADNSNLAIKSLTEQYPYMAMLIGASVASQVKMTQIQNQQSEGDAAGVISDTTSWLWSNSDLRSWLTLPDNVQVFQTPLLAGDYTLALNDDNVSNDAAITVKENGFTLVWVTQLGTNLQVETFNF